jgi:hypothetical protein
MGTANESEARNFLLYFQHPVGLYPLFRVVDCFLPIDIFPGWSLLFYKTLGRTASRYLFVVYPMDLCGVQICFQDTLKSTFGLPIRLDRTAFFFGTTENTQHVQWDHPGFSSGKDRDFAFRVHRSPFPEK